MISKDIETAMSAKLDRKNRWRRLGLPRDLSRASEAYNTVEVASLLEQRTRLSILLLEYERRLKDAEETSSRSVGRVSKDASERPGLEDTVVDLSAKIAFDAKIRSAFGGVICGLVQESSGKRTAAKLRKLPLFDREWYAQTYLRGERPGTDPAMDYAKSGFWRGRFPNPLFDTRYYLRENADVSASGINPLIHYAECGWREGRNPNRYFSVAWYLSHYQDVREQGTEPLRHYIEFGAAERRDPGPSFSTARYMSSHPELEVSKVNPLAHFLNGKKHNG